MDIPFCKHGSGHFTWFYDCPATDATNRQTPVKKMKEQKQTRLYRQLTWGYRGMW
jgi:hypothetical protein